MYNIKIESPLFNGKSKVEQHKMVTSVLGKEMEQIHGFNLKTKNVEEQTEEAQEEITDVN